MRALRLELAALEQQQRDDLLQLIAAAFPPGEVFSATQIWHQPELRTACLEADLATVKQLGVWLHGGMPLIARVTRNGDGIVWSVSADDLHEEARVRGDDDV